MIKLINAHDRNGLIGKGNIMPWHIKEELAFFKEETSSHYLLMGRKTFEGINKVLPNRTTYVLTRDKLYNYDDDNVIVINDAQRVIDKFKDSDEILYIAGGKEIYQQFYQVADELIISIIKDTYQGDTYFIDIDYSKYELITEVDYPLFTLKRYRKY
ncbi:dihydrofolate reductase [Erysipelotrichaceae bacterium OttesenSCG-928-M19]|nr:dihydrofolate reductase [Erysipelotrichaceae bacterium OttesenSCG-928-M19]